MSTELTLRDKIGGALCDACAGTNVTYLVRFMDLADAIMPMVKAAISRAREEERERCAETAERDTDWTAFQRQSKKDPLSGDETNVFFVPTNENVTAYRIGIATGRAIAAAIRALPLSSPPAARTEGDDHDQFAKADFDIEWLKKRLNKLPPGLTSPSAASLLNTATALYAKCAPTGQEEIAYMAALDLKSWAVAKLPSVSREALGYGVKDYPPAAPTPSDVDAAVAEERERCVKAACEAATAKIAAIGSYGWESLSYDVTEAIDHAIRASHQSGEG